MSNFIGGGKTVAVNPSGADIVGFNPRRDVLDFGDISVHGLILGSLADGTAAIVNPWRPMDYQTLVGLTWGDLSMENMGVVGNEHLRQDIGAVLSWEKNIGVRDNDTIYVRSHQYGVQEVVNDFDPISQKLNFIYTGTRERLSVEDTKKGLLISFEPSGQSLLLSGITRTDLIGANLEFHHDQVEEDNLEVPFGFKADEVSLVSRRSLLTPAAPAGAGTDGDQQRSGRLKAPVQDMAEMPQGSSMHDHSMHDHSMADHAMTGNAADGSGGDPDAVSPLSPSSHLNADELQLSVDGSLYWGGMSGVLTLKNCCTRALEDWKVSFVTPHSNFRAWSGKTSVKEQSDGTYQVTLRPAQWNNVIPAGGTLAIDFNADSVGLPNSGELNDALFFAGESAPVGSVPAPADQMPAADSATIEPQNASTVQPVEQGSTTSSGLRVESTITGGWSGTFDGEITVSNPGNKTLAAGWSISFISDHRLRTVSNFTLKQRSRADGRYEVTLSAPSWSRNAPFQPGERLRSYYQAAGDLPSEEQPFEVSAGAGADPVGNETTAAPRPAKPVEKDPESPEAVVPSDTVKVDYQAPDGVKDKRLVTYFEEWGIYTRDVNLSDVDGQSMTHLNYSFFDVKSDGSIALFDSFAAEEKRFTQADQVSRRFTKEDYANVDASLRKAYNSDRYTITRSDDSVLVTSVPVGWNGAGMKDAGNFEQLRRFKELNPDVNLGFALGGWTLSDEFSTAYSSKAGRDRFTDEVVRIFRQYDFFNTVDFDWEYPGGGGKAGNAVSAEDGANFARVLKQLRGKLDTLSNETGEAYEVSIATAGGYEKLENLNLEGIDNYVDFYNVMTYDFHGGWENETGHQAAMTGDSNNYDVTSAVEFFEKAGVDLGKLVMGAPAYTRAWGDVSEGGTFGYQQPGRGSAAAGSFEAGVYDYKDIVNDVITGRRDLYWDDDNKAAFVYDGDEWSSMETPATIAGKAAFIEEKGLGGMMFWALSNDAEGDLSLVRAADDLLRKGVSYADVVDRAPEFDSVVGGNQKFSISDFTDLV